MMGADGYSQTFTLGSKLEAVMARGAEELIHPLMKEYVKNAPRPDPVPKPEEVYPGLGLTSAAKPEPGQPPPFPVCGPSQPNSGYRTTEAGPFDNLSMQMAAYNYNRTTCVILHPPFLEGGSLLTIAACVPSPGVAGR